MVTTIKTRKCLANILWVIIKLFTKSKVLYPATIIYPNHAQYLNEKRPIKQITCGIIWSMAKYIFAFGLALMVAYEIFNIICPITKNNSKKNHLF